MTILSIIIPIYNVEKYLDECLQSVVGIENIEVILVNDCTPDKSIEVAKFYMEKFDNIKLIHHNSNKGLGEARNTGIKNANGKYIAFLDSDDYLDISKLKALLNTLSAIDHDQVLISYIRFSEERGNFPLDYEKVYTENNGKVLKRSDFKILANIINLSQIRIIKRDKILSDKIRFPDGLYEDVLWSYWFAYSCKSTLVLDNRIYFYRQHPDSILGSTSKRHMEIIKQYQRTMDLFKSKNASLSIMSILEHRFIIATRYVLFSTQRIPLGLKEEFSREIIDNMELFLLDNSRRVQQLEELDAAFANLTSIRFRYSPLKKIKAFKQFISLYNFLRGK